MVFENEQESSLWAMYFATVAGWQFHPGNTKGQPDKFDNTFNLADCAVIADMMLIIHRDRVKR